MGSVNKAIIMGRVGQEPRFGKTKTGKTYCSFSVATDDRYKDASGEWVDNTEWHNIQTWGRLAEVCGEYVTKGREVHIIGRITYREADGKYYTDIKADDVQFIGGKPAEAPAREKRTPQPEPEPAFDLADDDLPF